MAEDSEADEIRPDPVIEAYKKDIDRTLLRETLKLTHEERLLKMQRFVAAIGRVRGAARRPGP
jgi:hypothetical protein